MLALLVLSADRDDSSYTSTSEVPTFHIPESWKRYPSRAEPPHIGHYREYLSPPPLDCIFPIFKTVCCIFFAEKCFQSVEVSLFLFVKLNVGSTVNLFHSMISSHS